VEANDPAETLSLHVVSTRNGDAETVPTSGSLKHAMRSGRDSTSTPEIHARSSCIRTPTGRCEVGSDDEIGETISVHIARARDRNAETITWGGALQHAMGSGGDPTAAPEIHARSPGAHASARR